MSGEGGSCRQVAVIDADGLQLVSNEVFRPGEDGRAVLGAPVRTQTLEELLAHGYAVDSRCPTVVGGR